MTEHDEAFLVEYLRDVIEEGTEEGAGPPTADELLALCRDAMACQEGDAKRLATSHMADDLAAGRVAAADVETWRRILASPALAETLVAIEDEGIFGGQP